jgi:hypothetical protein
LYQPDCSTARCSREDESCVPLGAGNIRSHRVPELDAGGLEHDSADQLGGYANHLS